MPSDDRPFRLDVTEPDPPPHLLEQLAAAARQSTPTRRAGRRGATVSVGVVAALAGVGGAWAAGALPVPGLPDGGLPAIVERSRDAPSDRPSEQPTRPAPTSTPEGSGSSSSSPSGSPDATQDGPPTDRPGEQRPSGLPSRGDPSSSTPTGPPTSPPSATPPSSAPAGPDRGGENPGRGDERRNPVPGGDRGQGQRRSQGQGQQDRQRESTGRDAERGRPDRDPLFDRGSRGRGPDA